MPLAIPGRALSRQRMSSGHLTLRAKKTFISADIEMNRCSYPDPHYASEGAVHAEASKITARLLVLGQFLGKQRQ